MAKRRKAETAQPLLQREVRLRSSLHDVEGVRPWGDFHDPATSVVVEYPLDLSLTDALRQLDESIEAARVHDLLIGGQVGAARAAGASWALIGQAFGQTGESVRKRWASRLGE